MSTRNTKKLSTDKNTDLLFDYFINEEKFNEQLKPTWNDEIQKKTNKSVAKSDIKKSDKKKSNIKYSEKNSDKKENINSYMLGSSQEKDKSVDFTESISSIKASSSEKHKSQKHKSHKNTSVKKDKVEAIVNDKIVKEAPVLLGPQLVDNIKNLAETPEERRARQRTIYAKLQDLVANKNVVLYQKFTIDSDPDIMEEEYKLHENRRKKTNQVKFYKNILINVISGIEFLNDKYDPFDIKLKDWSKQVATDVDDYTEILEEIYDKHRNKLGKMSPEIKLLFMLIMSGVTYHISQALFGSAGLSDAVKNNPNILSKLMGGLMKDEGEMGKNGLSENNVVPDKQQLLEKIRNLNKNKDKPKEEVKSPVKADTLKTSESNIISVVDGKLSPKYSETQTESISKIKNNIINSKPIDNIKNILSSSEKNVKKANVVLSNNFIKPDSPKDNIKKSESEKKLPTKIDAELKDIIESLDSSSDSIGENDLFNKSVPKSNNSIKSARNSNTKSSTRKNTNSAKKNNITQL